MSERLPRLVSMRRPEVLLLVVTACLFAFYYFGRADTIGVLASERGWSPMTAPPLAPALHYLSSLVLLAVIPLIVAQRLSRARLSQFGLGLGEWRRGLPLLAVGIPLAVLAGWIAAGNPAMRAVYPLDATVSRESFLPHALVQLIYLASWECLFRGVLLFGLRGRFGEGSANALQTGLSVTAHFGRAISETFAALPAGFVFGWLNLRVGSIWYLTLIHWVVGVSMEWFILA